MERVVSGLLNKQVAAELGTSESTVKVHRGQVMQKDERSTWLTRFARSFIRSRVDNSTRTCEESASDPTEAALNSERRSRSL
jgi:hypothetical protein